MKARAILVGNSDGIGLALTRRLLDRGWRVDGVSRSKSPVRHDAYSHLIMDVRNPGFTEGLEALVKMDPPDLCVYCVGIGEELDLSEMRREAEIFDVNLTGMVRTAAEVIPVMVRNGRGHFMGISSMADEFLSAEAPSYNASKAGFSSYLRSLARAVRRRGVRITMVRFGFVDTKMAKGDVKPFLMSVDRAVDHLERCLRKRPVRYTAPAIMIPLIKLHRLMMWLGAKS